MAISKRSKEYITVAFADAEVAKEVSNLLDTADRLVRQMQALIEKMDADVGVSDTDYKEKLDSVK